jgi:hypothetical protein
MHLKMELKTLLYSLILFVTFCSYSQDTVFLTASPDEAKEYNNFITQFSFSIPLSVNPRRGEADQYSQENDSWLIPDGISAHGGAGFHLKKWVALSANTGVDWRIKQKLVSVPVYAALTLNPHFNKETSVMLQAGLGHAFAIGRGDLSGTYQKYRAGIFFNDILIFADASMFGFPLEDTPEMGSFTLGISLLNFN